MTIQQNLEQTNAAPVTIGTPVYRDGYGIDEKGYIAEIKAAPGNVFVIGRSMEKVESQYLIAWERLSVSEVSDGIAAPWIATAARYDIAPISEAAARDLLEKGRKSDADAIAQRQQEHRDREARVEAFRDQYRDKIPAWAKAVIVAEFERDDSDSMTDYFNTTTEKTVLLAFSSHTRNNFSEMRKAAANYAATAELADSGPEAEHRENYSMGAGYYLKTGHRYSDGWTVKKRVFYSGDKINDRAQLLPFGEWAIPENQPEPGTTRARSTGPKASTETPDNLPAEVVNGCTIYPRTHTKKGFRMFIVELPARVESDKFRDLLNTAKAARGWYSRKWGDSPAGFAFKDADAARKFAEGVRVNV